MKMEKHKDYFEGILQLRNPNEDVLELFFKLIEKRMDIFIAKQVKVVNGVDIYISSQKFLQHLGKQLKKNFHGELKISRRLHTRNRITGKNVYRVTVLFRMINIKKGDIVNFKGEKIKIIGISKKILAKNLDTGKKLSLTFSDL